MLKSAFFAATVLFPFCAAYAADALPGWVLIWSDEFDGHTLDASKWEFEVNARGGGNNELQYYVTNNVRVRDGFLRLGEPCGCLFLFCFAFRFPITRLGLAVPLSFDFALDRITADLATVFGGELVSLDLPGDCEGNLVTLEFAI